MTDAATANPQLGQVWTPAPVAERMVRMMLEHLEPLEPATTLRVLDPCVGPGTFLSPLLQAAGVAPADRGVNQLEIDAVEIDADLLAGTRAEFSSAGGVGAGAGASVAGDVPQPVVQFIEADYLLHDGRDDYDAVILNPPYVRHELIASHNKQQYREKLAQAGVPLPAARSNLYGYFLLKAMSQLKPGAVMCAIVHSNLHTTSYGQQIWNTLQQHMHVLHTERLEVPFSNAMIDAEIFIARKLPHPRRDAGSEAGPEAGATVGSAAAVEVPPTAGSAVQATSSYVKLGELLRITRGSDLVNRRRFVRPGPPEQTPDEMPLVLRTPARGQLVVDVNARILVNDEGDFPVHRLRTSKVIFNYYLRHSPRHLWNESGAAVSDNFLLLHSDSIADEAVWLLLNSTVASDQIMRAAKPQGSGLHKLQVYQYRDVEVPDWRRLSPDTIRQISKTASRLIHERAEQADVRAVADSFIEQVR